jgi:protein tyrosine/serine phosphatase/8-oxo-dGTP pyrophosphatase MutT (NUDIX family)
MLRRVPFEKIENFRDLGGYAARYGETSFGVVYRSGTLADATDADIDKLAHLGIKTIIDIRDDDSKKDRPDRTQFDKRFATILLPVNGNGRVPKDHQDQIESYLEMLEDPASARKIFLSLAHALKPVVLHCTAGKDRTGAFIAVLLLANGVPFHDVNADYMLSFPYLTRMTRLTMAAYPDFPKTVLTPDVNFLKEVMEKFNARWGQVDDYFRFIGISDDDIALLDNLLGKQEKSCGAVVFHEGKILVEHMKKGHYSIPKGHVEKFDKDDQATALREIKEETNIDARILSDETWSIDYSTKEGVAKRVVFFIADCQSTETKVQPEEVTACYWLSPDDAIRTVSHDSDKKIITWACQLKASLKH